MYPKGGNPAYRAAVDARLARKAANKAAWAEKNAQARELAEKQSQARGAVRKLGHMADASNRAQRRLGTGVPDPRLLPDDQLIALTQALMDVDRYDWRANARPEQIFTDLDFAILLLMCGRGWGKTRAAAEAVREEADKGNRRIAVIAKDHRALRDVCFEGISGLLHCIPGAEVKEYRKGLGDVSLTLTNGTQIKGYTAGEPDAIRGQSFHLIWGDEFAAWPKHRAGDMLTQARMCLRESEDSKAILSTTPKRVSHVIDMVDLAKDPGERIIVVTGHSRENTVLTNEWFRQMDKMYGGTRIGRQEMGGELLLDNEFALWRADWLASAQWDSDEELPQMVGVVVGVDPSGSKDGDATGIVTVGWDRNKVLYVLDNRTTNGTPAERYTAVCMTAWEWNASEICYESSYGGDNAAFGIAEQWKNLVRDGELPADSRCPMIEKSKLKGDKAARAMPLVTIYEQQHNLPDRRRIFHVIPSAKNQLARLEDEQLTWETNSAKSPNAIDALVHAGRRVIQKNGLETSVALPGAGRTQESGGVIKTVRRRLGGSNYNPFG